MLALFDPPHLVVRLVAQLHGGSIFGSFLFYGLHQCVPHELLPGGVVVPRIQRVVQEEPPVGPRRAQRRVRSLGDAELHRLYGSWHIEAERDDGGQNNNNNNDDDNNTATTRTRAPTVGGMGGRGGVGDMTGNNCGHCTRSDTDVMES